MIILTVLLILQIKQGHYLVIKIQTNKSKTIQKTNTYQIN
jgi:hypothetical protein